MAKYVYRDGLFVEAEQNKDGSYTISGVSRMSKEQFEQEFIKFPESHVGEWLFFNGRPVDTTTERYKGLHKSWEECTESGFECSICGRGGATGIGPGKLTERNAWACHDERTPFCPYCGSEMIRWEETYEEWKERNEKLQGNA